MKDRRFPPTIILMAVGIVAVAGALIATLFSGDWPGLMVNVCTDVGGALLIYFLLERFIERRERREARKQELIAQMGSQVRDVAIAATEELGSEGWLSDGSLQGVHFTDANLEGARLMGADLQKAVLMHVNLAHAHGLGGKFNGVVFFKTNLDEAELQLAEFRKAKLVWTCLRKANLLAADLREAVINYSCLEGATLASAKLQGARMAAANLQGASLVGAKVEDCTYSRDTILPDGTKWTPETDMTAFTKPEEQA